MRRYRSAVVVAGAVAGACSSVWGADFLVHSAAEIRTALGSARAGDTVTMANGTWTDQTISFTGTGITLRAQTPGRVVLNGSSKISISGSYLTVDGLEFRGGALTDGDTIVKFTSSASNCRLTNSSIIDYNPASIDTRYFWVGVSGSYCRVDHNFFRGQSNSGVTLVVSPTASQPCFAQIDDNHFVDRPVGNGNGFETIRLGTSDVQTVQAHITVQSNLFERTNGEIETISNKTSNNLIQYNTFRKVEGTVTLRHGSGTTVQGNFFLGENDGQSGGIRVIGPNHVIANNYFQDLGNRGDGAISLTTGQTDFNPGGPNSAGYEGVTNVQVVNNTIVNAKDAAIRMDDLYGDSSTQTARPSNLQIANNLIYNTQTSLIKGTVGTSVSWAGNIAFGNSLGISARPGIAQVNPALATDAAGLRRPGTTSPAIDAGAVGPFLRPADDMDGQARTGAIDVGADEYAPGVAATRGPLSGSDVGPSWLKRRTMPDGTTPYATAVIGFRAVDYTAVTDPNADGATWSATGSILKAPATPRTDLPGTQDAVAEYDVAFHDTGKYYLFGLLRGISTSSDSLYVPAALGADPSVTVNLNSGAGWAWVLLGQYTIATGDLNEPLTLRIGKREGNVEMDQFLFKTDSALPTTVPEPAVGVVWAGLAMSVAVRRPKVSRDSTRRRGGRG